MNVKRVFMDFHLMDAKVNRIKAVSLYDFIQKNLHFTMLLVSRYIAVIKLTN